MLRLRMSFLITFFFFCSLSSYAHAQSCLVVEVTDGHSLSVRCGSRAIEHLRFADAEAPHLRQPFGDRARQHLAALCSGKQAIVKRMGYSPDGRTLAVITCEGVETGAAQVLAGLAWVNPVLGTPARSKFLFPLQDYAQRNGAGLWVDPLPVPPWEWKEP